MTADLEPPRVLSRVEREGGPTVVILCAVHGNEPAGLVAARRVLATLRGRIDAVRGRIVGVVANRAALTAGRRFLGEDLNRGWRPQTLERVADPARDRVPEDAERRQLWATLQEVTEGQPAVFVDLHTMSGPGAPFVVVPAPDDNRRLGTYIAAPSVRGLDELTDGALLHLLTEQGHRGVGFEGGAHDAPSSELHLEAAVWSVLGAVDAIELADFPEATPVLTALRTATARLPSWVEIADQHLIGPDDEFRMEPGWSSFDPVQEDQLVAHDRNGPIHASVSGVLVLPNYQGTGDHGFFIGYAS